MMNHAELLPRISLKLHGSSPELYQTIFRRDNGEVLNCIRGKAAGAISATGTFQWTSAVKALTLVLCKVAAQKFDGEASCPVSISGKQGSLASSLDYALSKQPLWLIEMFGVDGTSNSYLRRILQRTNAERKFPGPVVVSVNPRNINCNSIECWWNNSKIESKEEMHRLINLIEKEVSQPLEAFLPAAA
jgi:hypothetical protein